MKSPAWGLSLVLAWTACCCAGPASSPPTGHRPPPPNIVFILADDLGYAELGCYGQKKIPTPHIDRLAAQGMRLLRHYSGAPVCAPSRCVLLTGLHPGHAFIRSNREVQPEGQLPLPDDQVTLAEVLTRCGYVCGAFGKWGLGPVGSTGDPLRQGFARFFGYNCQRHAHSYFPAYLWDDDHRIALDNHPPVPGHAQLPPGADPADPAAYLRFIGNDYAPQRIADQALAFLQAHRDRPFFLYYPTIIPHLALQVRPQDLENYRGRWPETPLARAAYTPHPTPRAAYAAMIGFLDRQVGRLLDRLDRLGLADRTIVVFTSDNGTTYLRDVDYRFFQSVGPLRGLKGSIYEGGLRVPAIVRWPGHIRPGSTSDRLTGFEDWMASLLELVGASDRLPPHTDSISFASTLLGRPQPPRPPLYREFAGYGGQQALWFDGWKLVRRNLQQPARLTTELYHLASDPAEQHDLAADRPDLVAKALALMARHHTPSPQFPLRALDGPANDRPRGRTGR